MAAISAAGERCAPSRPRPLPRGGTHRRRWFVRCFISVAHGAARHPQGMRHHPCGSGLGRDRRGRQAMRPIAGKPAPTGRDTEAPMVRQVFHFSCPWRCAPPAGHETPPLWERPWPRSAQPASDALHHGQGRSHGAGRAGADSSSGVSFQLSMALRATHSPRNERAKRPRSRPRQRSPWPGFPRSLASLAGRAGPVARPFASQQKVHRTFCAQAQPP